MSVPGQPPPYFLCLCEADRQPLYGRLCGALRHRIEFARSVEETLARGLQQPPLAIILDLATTIRLGVERMSLFLNLGVSWPVLRCLLGDSGEPRVMCFEPAHSVSLFTALDAIAAEQPEWQHPRFHRRFLRVSMLARARLRVFDEARWRAAELRDMSSGGCFLHMQDDPPPPGAKLVVELSECDGGPERVAGFVAWSRWIATTTTPGMGVEFDLQTVTENIRDYLASSPHLAGLLSEG